MLVHGLDADLVAQYLAETGSNCKPRPIFNLPWSATAEGLPAGRGYLLRLTAPASLHIKADPSAVVLQHGGRTYRFPRGVTAIIDQLADGTPKPIGDLLDTLTERFDEETVRLLVALLVKHDLIALTPDDNGRA